MRSSRRVACILSATVIAGASVAACGSSSSSSGAGSAKSAAPLEVLLEVPLSEAALQDYATTAVTAARAAVSVINAKGGVGGRKIDLDVVDDGGDPTTAVTDLDQAIHSAHPPDAVLLADSSPESSAVLPIATQNKILTFNDGVTADSGDPSKYPYNFDMEPSTVNYASAFCPYVKAHGGTSVAILTGNDAYGTALNSAMAASCKADGVDVVGNEEFSDTALDMTPQLLALKAKNPSYLLLQACCSSTAYVLQDINKLNWNVPVLGDSSVAISTPASAKPPTGMIGTPLVANLKVETFASTVYQPAAQTPPALATALGAMKTAGAIKVLLIQGVPYDSVMLFAQAVKDAGSDDSAAALAKALEGTPSGQSGTAIFSSYHFSAGSHSNVQPADQFTFVTPAVVNDGQIGAP